MNYLLLLLFIFFYTSINSQLLDEKLNKELISYYEEYLITNPQPSNIIEISDTLRILWDNVNMLNHHSYCYCNCIEVAIKNNKVFLEGKRIKLSRLQEKMFSYYNNYERKQYLPEREVLKDTLFGFFVRSKGIFDIISFNANPSVYSEVIKISKNIFNAKRNYWATTANA